MASRHPDSPIDMYECPECGAQFSLGGAEGGLTQYPVLGYECPTCKEVIASNDLIDLPRPNDPLNGLFDDVVDGPVRKKGILKPDKVLKTRAKEVFSDGKKIDSESLSRQSPGLLEIKSSFSKSSDEDRTVLCTPLMEVAHPKLYRDNGFRIAGLHVDATPRELSKHADKLKVMDQIGYGHAANTAAFPLEPLPTLDQIRKSMQQLKDPEKRLIDEFFWFWPETFGESSKDQALQALARGDGAGAYDIWTERKGVSSSRAVAYHNLAVLMHMLALDWTRSYIDSTPDEEAAKRIKDYWRKANRYWKRTNDNDFIWDVVKERIRTLDDERLTTGFGRRMREVLAEALCSINTQLAFTYAEQNKIDDAKRHLVYIQDFGLTRKQQEKLLDAVFAPYRKRLLQSGEAIDSEKDNVRKLELSSSLATQARAIFPLFEFFYGATSNQRIDLFDQIILSCVNATSSFTSENNVNQACLGLLKWCLDYAFGEELRARIYEFKINVCATYQLMGPRPV
jgi:hypothetical protein